MGFKWRTLRILNKESYGNDSLVLVMKTNKYLGIRIEVVVREGTPTDIMNNMYK